MATCGTICNGAPEGREGGKGFFMELPPGAMAANNICALKRTWRDSISWEESGAMQYLLAGNLSSGTAKSDKLVLQKITKRH